MFKWLADMLVKTPVQGTCSCCEGKKKQLQEMQEAITRGSLDSDIPQNPDEAIMNCDTPEHEYTGKILGSVFYGGYPVVVKDRSSPVEEEESSCSCSTHGCCKK